MRLGEVGVCREIDPLAGHPADRAHQQRTCARVDRRAEVVNRCAPGTMPDESQLDAPLAARVCGSQADLGVFEVAEHDVVAGLEGNRLDGVV